MQKLPHRSRNAEKEGLSSYHKGAYHVFGGLIAGYCTWDVEECHEAFLPFKRICKSDGECAFRHGGYGVLAAEFEDSFNERLEYSSLLCSAKYSSSEEKSRASHLSRSSPS